MDEKKKYTINTVPSLTWNWLKSNCDIVELGNEFSAGQLKYEKLPENISVSSEGPVTALDFTKSAVFNIPDEKYGDAVKTAQNARITTAAKQSAEDISQIFAQTVKTPQHFEIKGKAEVPSVLIFEAKANQIAQQTIHVLKDSTATVIIVYKSDNEAENTTLFQTKVFVEENACLKLIKVQLLNKSAVQLDDTQIIEGDNAEVAFTQIELGGIHVDSGLHVTLQGYQSKFTSNVAYLCQNKQYLDMNHIVYHYGKKSECDMLVNGTLKDESVKTYRGTIDLKNGCCGAVGKEMEETLLLSPETVNKSLPVILCDEEDVEGEHGATIGRLSSDILFYMQSRGIDEKSAEQIMAKAKIQAAADSIPDERVRNLIQDWLNNN